MKQLFKHKIIFFLTLLWALGTALQSCEEVISLDLNDADPMLTVDGLISLGEVAEVQLSYTGDYFAYGEPKHEENAAAVISASNGFSETLSHQGNGFYTGKLIRGRVGVNYQLSISVDGKRYTGSSQLMIPAEIVKLGYKPFDSFGQEGQYNLGITIKNSPDKENYFLIKYFFNDEEKEESYSTLSHGYFPKEETIEFSPFNLTFTVDDEVTVRAYAIDKDTYNYYSQLYDILHRHGGSSTPYNPASNMGKDVLGYFRAWSFDEQSIKVVEEK